jgi:hypothetical protein
MNSQSERMSTELQTHAPHIKRIIVNCIVRILQQLLLWPCDVLHHAALVR